ncbi:MAG: hypothetical protein J2P26_00710 [Nocardiopsaceae bacterium]|nr:hypothetical protein [Nocardiopsaceae bacterium]
MPRPEPRARHNTLDNLMAARDEARRAVHRVALDDGAQTISRPAFPGAQATVRDVEPLAGARAARKIELAARAAATGYIRDAREAGHTWHDIGEALGVVPGGDAGQAGETVAEAAYCYAIRAAGQPGPQAPGRAGSFWWHCRSCDQVISDQGHIGTPADNEPGHADSCPRLATAIAEWDASWEAEP